MNAPRAQGHSWYVCSVAYAHAFVKRRLEEAGIQGFSFWYICFCYVDRKLILLSILHRDSCIFHARLAHKRCISWLIIHVFLRQNVKKWSRLTCLACIVRKSRRVRPRRRRIKWNHFLRRRVRRRKYRSARKRAKGVPFVRCSEPQPLSNESPVKRVSFESLSKTLF